MSTEDRAGVNFWLKSCMAKYHCIQSTREKFTLRSIKTFSTDRKKRKSLLVHCPDQVLCFRQKKEKKIRNMYFKKKINRIYLRGDLLFIQTSLKFNRYLVYLVYTRFNSSICSGSFMVLIHILNFNLWLLPKDFTEVATIRCNSFCVLCKTLVYVVTLGKVKKDIYVLFWLSSGYLFVLINLSSFIKSWRQSHWLKVRSHLPLLCEI